MKSQLIRSFLKFRRIGIATSVKNMYIFFYNSQFISPSLSSFVSVDTKNFIYAQYSLHFSISPSLNNVLSKAITFKGALTSNYNNDKQDSAKFYSYSWTRNSLKPIFETICELCLE